MKPFALVLVTALFTTSLHAGESPRLDDLLKNSFTYRNLGPFRAGSWVTDLAVPETPLKAHLYTLYVATRNGGVWKTTNNGVTFQPIFESQNMLSIGSVAVAPTDENTVWVGTGDPSCTRSSNRGDGVYKSTDGGKTWQFMGLGDSHHISRVIIHPKDPNIVYVAALGHLFSPNEERGVFKTVDGGKTWKKILYVNERSGAVDLVLNRRDPNILYAATYDCMRRPWEIQDGGPGTGIYKTTDAGANWQRLEGGLPTGTLGRVGIDLFQKNPDIVYAVIDNRNRSTNAAPAGRRGGGGLPALVGGEMYRSDDGGKTWRKTSSDADDLSRKSGYAFNVVRVDSANPDRLFLTGASLALSQDGGRTWGGISGGSGAFRRAFGDFRIIWIDQENADRVIAGSDGGVFLSYDGGQTCDHLANMPLGEVYALTVDMETPYNIYAGLQDHESWKGPVEGWAGSVGFADWVTVGTGDGMYNQVDPTDSRWVYNTQEFGSLSRLDQKTRVRIRIQPTRPADQPRLRINWVAPVQLSPHDPKTIYSGAQVLFRSRDRGDTWEEISPDLTKNDPTKISPPGAAIQFCTITTISESPAQAGVIWVGVDDGKVQVTRDAGKNWTDVTGEIVKAGGPDDAWVTRVRASHFQPGTAYVSKSRHRQDDFRPFLFKTTDYGATWKAITNNLPDRPINVVFEDNKNPNLLFVGNDAGIYTSLDGGGRWHALKGNMPFVTVHDLVIHPRDGDIVAGTYGRGVWVADITPLRELSEQMMNEDAHFFTVTPKPVRRDGALGNYRLYGDNILTTPNGPNGTVFQYYLKQAPTGTVNITLADASGTTVRTIPGTTRPGINRVQFVGGGGGRGGGGGGGRRGGGAPTPALAPGEYTVTLNVGDKTYSQKVRFSEGQTAAPEEPPAENADDNDG